MATETELRTKLPPGTHVPKPKEYRCPCGRELYIQCTDGLYRCSRCAYAYESAAFEDRVPAVLP